MGIERENNRPKIIIIIGPTSSGKSDLAVDIAKKFNGEIISADSRQVYKNMDIGTGKITKKEMKGVPHYLLDVANPNEKFTVAQFKKLGEEVVKKIIKKEKVPIVCGGTAFYIKALVDGIVIPEVSPDWELRKSLEKKTTEDLYKELLSLDKKRGGSIDKQNRRRLIRAIEIIKKTEKPIPKIKRRRLYNPLFLEIKKDQEELDERIRKRIEERLEKGMVEEVENLLKKGVSWNRLEELGLEYRWIGRYLKKKISYKEMIENLFIDTRRFSKRQKSWWKNDKRVKQIRDKKEAEIIVNNFLV